MCFLYAFDYQVYMTCLFVCLAQCLFFVFQKPYVKYLNRLDYEKGIICSSTCYGIG